MHKPDIDANEREREKKERKVLSNTKKKKESKKETDADKTSWSVVRYVVHGEVGIWRKLVMLWLWIGFGERIFI